MQKNIREGFLGSIGLQKRANLEGYMTTIPASITISTNKDDRLIYDYNSQISVGVTFEIQLEARSWGIKDATVSIRSINPIEIEVENLETKQGKIIRLIVDPSKLKQTSTNFSGYIGVEEMEITTDINGNIDYDNSEIVVSSF